MIEIWLLTTGSVVGLILTSTLFIYVLAVLLTRVNGLRTFSKMSSFDFAITVAVGTVVASTALAPTPSLLEGGVALATLFGLQRLMSWLRVRTGASDVVDNQPLLLMVGPDFLYENLKAARVTRADILAKLREANVLDFDEVRAVVLETTGDISVLHGDPDEKKLNPALLEGVMGGEKVER